jgi:hypothetical protein
VPFAISEYLENGRLEEEHLCINIFNLGKNSTETSEMFEVAVGEQVVGRTQIFEWFLKFKSGVVSV